MHIKSGDYHEDLRPRFNIKVFCKIPTVKSTKKQQNSRWVGSVLDEFYARKRTEVFEYSIFTKCNLPLNFAKQHDGLTSYKEMQPHKHSTFKIQCHQLILHADEFFNPHEYRTSRNQC